MGTSRRWAPVAISIVFAMAPSVAMADACLDYRLARTQRDAVDTYINKMDQNYLLAEKGIEEAYQLIDEADARLEQARGAVRHTLQNASGAAITIDTLSELDFLASKGMGASWEWVHSSDQPPPPMLQAKILSIMNAINETRDEAFKALCR